MIAPHPDLAPFAGADEPPDGWGHTHGEWRVARRVAAGMSTTAIAAALGMSYHTADMYIRRVATRLRELGDRTPGSRRERVAAHVQTFTPPTDG